jgi:hypothetical protein
MSRDVTEEWLEPLDWIEADASANPLTSDPSVNEISERGFAAWTRLLARLDSGTNLDSSA